MSFVLDGTLHLMVKNANHQLTESFLRVRKAIHIILTKSVGIAKKLQVTNISKLAKLILNFASGIAIIDDQKVSLILAWILFHES